jgi:hypothetical protein
MWGPRLNSNSLALDFLVNAFGKAAEPMGRVYGRWAWGERFSPRQLKLALLDLQDACRQESEPGVRARLDRVAMYLHWLRLHLDYERATRIGEPEDIQRCGKELIVYSRRLMDTGLIHAYPMLFSEWFKSRFRALEKVKGLEPKEVEAWKEERAGVPSAEETARLLADDLKRFEGLAAEEIHRQEFSQKLVSVAERLPEAVASWRQAARLSQMVQASRLHPRLCVESGVHYFIGRKGEQLKLAFAPFDAGHTVDGHWVLRRVGEERPVAEGDVKAEKGQAATMETVLPADGVYALDPGTGYWKTAELGFAPRPRGGRPLSVWAGRADQPGKPKGQPFRLWLPRQDQPLYFLVPKGVGHFVIGFPSVGQAKTSLTLRTADGKVVLEDKAVLQGDQVSVRVPEGKDGAIWSLSLSSLRCVVELYNVPPYLARHPGELLVPQEAVELEAQR